MPIFYRFENGCKKMWCWEEGCGVIYTLQRKEGKGGERGRSERW